MAVEVKAPSESGPSKTLSPTATVLREEMEHQYEAVFGGEERRAPRQDHSRDDTANKRYREDVADGEFEIALDRVAIDGRKDVEEGLEDGQSLAADVGDEEDGTGSA